MTGRANPEWIGKSADTPIPDNVKLRIWDREKGLCYLTGRKLRAGEYDFEHQAGSQGQGRQRPRAQEARRHHEIPQPSPRLTRQRHSQAHERHR